MKHAVALLAFATLLTAAFAAPAQPRTVTDPDAPRSLPADGAVAVQWSDPAGFTDLKYSGNRWEAQRGNWVFQLADHLRRQAEKRLPAGERMEVTITDIDRAGRYEPWLGVQLHDVRVMRDIYPPMMALEFKRYGADGQLLSEGERRLRDPMYLHAAGTMPGSSDTLRHEKRLIDDWLRQELGRPLAAR